jgi:hypothetical protein
MSDLYPSVNVEFCQSGETMPPPGRARALSPTELLMYTVARRHIHHRTIEDSLLQETEGMQEVREVRELLNAPILGSNLAALEYVKKHYDDPQIQVVFDKRLDEVLERVRDEDRKSLFVDAKAHVVACLGLTPDAGYFAKLGTLLHAPYAELREIAYHRLNSFKGTEHEEMALDALYNSTSLSADMHQLDALDTAAIQRRVGYALSVPDVSCAEKKELYTHVDMYFLQYAGLLRADFTNVCDGDANCIVNMQEKKMSWDTILSDITAAMVDCEAGVEIVA